MEGKNIYFVKFYRRKSLSSGYSRSRTVPCFSNRRKLPAGRRCAHEIGRRLICSTCDSSFFLVVFASHLVVFSPFVLLFLPSRNSDPRSHSSLFSSLPTTVRPLHLFYRAKSSALSSPSSTRVEGDTCSLSSPVIILSLIHI